MIDHIAPLKWALPQVQPKGVFHGEIWVRVLCIHVNGLITLTAQDQLTAGKSNQVVLKYLGTAGWEITDGATAILIDPYLSRIKDRRRQGEDRATP